MLAQCGVSEQLLASCWLHRSMVENRGSHCPRFVAPSARNKTYMNDKTTRSILHTMKMSFPERRVTWKFVQHVCAEDLRRLFLNHMKLVNAPLPPSKMWKDICAAVGAPMICSFTFGFPVSAFPDPLTYRTFLKTQDLAIQRRKEDAARCAMALARVSTPSIAPPSSVKKALDWAEPKKASWMLLTATDAEFEYEISTSARDCNVTPKYIQDNLAHMQAIWTRFCALRSVSHLRIRVNSSFETSGPALSDRKVFHKLPALFPPSSTHVLIRGETCNIVHIMEFILAHKGKLQIVDVEEYRFPNLPSFYERFLHPIRNPRHTKGVHRITSMIVSGYLSLSRGLGGSTVMLLHSHKLEEACRMVNENIHRYNGHCSTREKITFQTLPVHRARINFTQTPEFLSLVRQFMDRRVPVSIQIDVVYTIGANVSSTIPLALRAWQIVTPLFTRALNGKKLSDFFQDHCVPHTPIDRDVQVTVM